MQLRRWFMIISNASFTNKYYSKSKHFFKWRGHSSFQTPHCYCVVCGNNKVACYIFSARDFRCCPGLIDGCEVRTCTLKEWVVLMNEASPTKSSQQRIRIRFGGLALPPTLSANHPQMYSLLQVDRPRKLQKYLFNYLLSVFRLKRH